MTVRPRPERQRRRAKIESRLLWVFGSPRTGTTWLLNLVAAHPDVSTMDEPGIGMHLALFAPESLGVPAASFAADQLRVNDSRAADSDYFFADRFRDVWQPSVRAMLLERLAAQIRVTGDPRLLIIKEPNGSLAADFLLQALPASRMLWVLRDGRDVVDSQLDAAKEGSWLSRLGGGMSGKADERQRFLEDRAHLWVARTKAVQRAYEGHDPALRHMIRYEDLLHDTLGVLRDLYSWLDIRVPDDLGEVVARRSFAALPTEQRGPGRFARAASPGLWRENLSADEQTTVNGVMQETLQALGYEA